MKINKGFTLIELLVVIAIIGVLASIIIGNLFGAVKKGDDSAIKANLGGVRTNSLIYYTEHNRNYGATVTSPSCTTGLFADTRIKDGIAAAQDSSSGTAICLSDEKTTTTGNANSWAVSVPLKTDTTISWCVDSSGAAKEGTASIISNVAACS